MNLDVASIIDRESANAADLLSDLIAFRSTFSNEREIQSYLAEHARKLGIEPVLVPMHPGIEADADYTSVPGHQGYEGRSNLLLTIPGTGGGRSVILNSHVDVVPASDEQFVPSIENGAVKGRGACDAKGQAVTILLALQALKEAGVRLKGDVTAQFVIEEEVGGNGTLSLLMDGIRADGVIVLEPTDLQVYPANRGAVWFRLSIDGKSTHMGRWRDGVNAVDEMMDTIRILKNYEQRLISESGGDPLFPDAAANVKVNIGTIQGGDWPSTLAGSCVVEGGVGFLPNKRLADIQSEVRREIETHASAWAREHYSLEFDRLHNEAFRTPPDHPLIQTLHSSVTSLGVESEIAGWTASCDARLFHHRGGMPTAVFGPGKFHHAHSPNEQISTQEITLGAKILADFLIRWCGS